MPAIFDTNGGNAEQEPSTVAPARHIRQLTAINLTCYLERARPNRSSDPSVKSSPRVRLSSPCSSLYAAYTSPPLLGCRVRAARPLLFCQAQAVSPSAARRARQRSGAPRGGFNLQSGGQSVGARSIFISTPPAINLRIAAAPRALLQHSSHCRLA